MLPAAAGRSASARAAAGGDAAAPPRRRREPCLSIRRLDLNLSRGSPPWRFQQSCSAQELLADALPGALDAARPATVSVAFAVDGGPRVLGFRVTGSMSIEDGVPLVCEYCAQPFSLRVSGAWRAWIDEGDGSVLEVQDDALGFVDDVCDLSPAVSDAICEAMPSILAVCGREACAREWRSRSWAAEGPSAAASSPFAALNKLLRAQDKA
jgi:uncharacterized metal-binding protein YceD (DUF177 family)